MPSSTTPAKVYRQPYERSSAPRKCPRICTTGRRRRADIADIRTAGVVPSTRMTVEIRMTLNRTKNICLSAFQFMFRCGPSSARLAPRSRSRKGRFSGNCGVADGGFVTAGEHYGAYYVHGTGPSTQTTPQRPVQRAHNLETRDVDDLRLDPLESGALVDTPPGIMGGHEKHEHLCWPTAALASAEASAVAIPRPRYAGTTPVAASSATPPRGTVQRPAPTIAPVIRSAAAMTRTPSEVASINSST